MRSNIALLESLFADISYVLGAFDVEQNRFQAEEARRLSEEKFAAAFASNPAAITLTRLDDGQFLDVNGTWLTLTGYSRAGREGRRNRRPVDLAHARVTSVLRAGTPGRRFLAVGNRSSARNPARRSLCRSRHRS